MQGTVTQREKLFSFVFGGVVLLLGALGALIIGLLCLGLYGSVRGGLDKPLQGFIIQELKIDGDEPKAVLMALTEALREKGAVFAEFPSTPGAVSLRGTTTFKTAEQQPPPSGWSDTWASWADVRGHGPRSVELDIRASDEVLSASRVFPSLGDVGSGSVNTVQDYSRAIAKKMVRSISDQYNSPAEIVKRFLRVVRLME